MSNFPIIFGIIGKKLYLTLLLALNMILYNLKNQIPKGNNVTLINSFCGSIIEMLSVFIPYLFKFTEKSATSTRKCTKVLFKNYFILFLIILLNFGLDKILIHFKVESASLDSIWISLCFQMIFYFLLSLIILKTKYYIHNIISSILFCIFTVVTDLILENFKGFNLLNFLSLIRYLFEDIQFCYLKYMIDKKYNSYWNIIFFVGLFFFYIRYNLFYNNYNNKSKK